MSKTLEEVLRKRLTDSRAMTGVLNINADRVFLDFGQIGDIEKVRFRITGDDIVLLYPRNDDPDPDGVLQGGQDGQNAVVGGADTTKDGTAVIAPENGADGASEVELVNPDDHLKDELIAIAEATPGIEFDPNATKQVIADAINAARAKAAEEAKNPAPQD